MPYGGDKSQRLYRHILQTDLVVIMLRNLFQKYKRRYTQMSIESSALISFDIGMKNLAVCVMSGPFAKKADVKELVVWEWRLMPLVCEGENCKRMRLDVLSQRIFKELDTLMSGLEERGCPRVAFVLIENQPSRINGSMKSIQMIIYSYFQYMRFKSGEHGIKEIALVNARLKLQDHDMPKEFLPENANDERSYKRNKDESVVYAKYYVREDDHLSNILKDIKKKDDICDAMLQGVAWSKKNQWTRQINRVISSET